MNYLAHGYRHLDRPYFLAGTAVPDWLSLQDRRVRLRMPLAAAAPDASEAARELCAGVAQHLADDRWFHQSTPFQEVSRDLTTALREAQPGDPRFRAHFLGHVLTELLVDAALMERDPGLCERYYESLQAADAQQIQAHTESLAGASLPDMSVVVERFRRVRFLTSYADDAGLLHRLGQVARRAGLPPLPGETRAVVTAARPAVHEQLASLLGDSELLRRR